MASSGTPCRWNRRDGERSALQRKTSTSLQNQETSGTGRCENKKVVITGGSSGIGLAAAQSLVDGGARVLITGRARETLDLTAEQLGENAVAAVRDGDQKVFPDARENPHRWGTGCGRVRQQVAGVEHGGLGRDPLRVAHDHGFTGREVRVGPAAVAGDRSGHRRAHRVRDLLNLRLSAVPAAERVVGRRAPGGRRMSRTPVRPPSHPPTHLPRPGRRRRTPGPPCPARHQRRPCPPERPAARPAVREVQDFRGRTPFRWRRGRRRTAPRRSRAGLVLPGRPPRAGGARLSAWRARGVERSRCRPLRAEPVPLQRSTSPRAECRA